MLITILLLILSISINVFLAWYARKTLSNLMYLSSNLKDLSDVIGDFDKHLNVVHELERFYGDPTLGNLLNHSKDVCQELQKFESIFILLEEEPEQEDEDGE